MLLAHLAHCDTVQQTHCHTVLQVVRHAVQQALSGVPGWDGETEGLGVLGGGGARETEGHGFGREGGRVEEEGGGGEECQQRSHVRWAVASSPGGPTQTGPRSPPVW